MEFVLLSFLQSDMPSAVIASIEYDESLRELIITFVSGLVYRYKEVPQELYAQLKSSREKGIYFNKNIRGKFLFEKS